MCDVTHSYLWHDLFICTGGSSWASVMWLIRIWPDPFTCVTWRILQVPAKNQQSLCDVTHRYMAWLFYLCDKNYLCVSARNQLIWCDVTYLHMTWLIHTYRRGIGTAIFEMPACIHMHDMTHWIFSHACVFTHWYRRRIVAKILEILDFKSSMELDS